MRFFRARSRAVAAALMGALGGMLAAVVAAQERPLLAAVASPQAAGATSPGRAVREIDDPSSGLRWFLVRDGGHPGGPGRLVPVKPLGSGGGPGAALPLPVMRAGDRVRVEEHSDLVDAVLEAVALESAAAGGPLRVRLRIGGRVVKVIALEPGRAALSADREALR